MITIRLDGSEQVQRRLANAPSAIRSRVLKVVAKRVLKLSQQRASKQTDLDGNRWQPHHLRRRRKMIIRLARRMRLVSVNDTEAVIGWASPVEGMIAAKQQLGAVQTVTAAENFGRSNQQRAAAGSAYATRRQAKQLIDAGYKRRVAGGKKTPSIKWITENMTVAQAGKILRILRGDSSAWTTKLPPRSFLGVSAGDMNELISLAVIEAEAALRI